MNSGTWDPEAEAEEDDALAQFLAHSPLPLDVPAASSSSQLNPLIQQMPAYGEDLRSDHQHPGLNLAAVGAGQQEALQQYTYGGMALNGIVQFPHGLPAAAAQGMAAAWEGHAGDWTAWEGPPRNGSWIPPPEEEMLRADLQAQQHRNQPQSFTDRHVPAPSSAPPFQPSSSAPKGGGAASKWPPEHKRNLEQLLTEDEPNGPGGRRKR